MTMLLLRNALLFDGLKDEPQERMDVLIDGNRIAEISATPLRATSGRSIDLAGKFLMPGLISGLMLPMVIGYTVIMAGPGFQTTSGAGRHSIMAVGFMTTIMDGHGYQATNGHRHGLPGVIIMIISAGHLLHPTLV